MSLRHVSIQLYPYTAYSYFTLTNGDVSVCLTLLPLASASSVSRTESQVPPPTALTPPQGAAPTSGASAPQARASSSQAEEDDDFFGVSDEAVAKYLSKN